MNAANPFERTLLEPAEKRELYRLVRELSDYASSIGVIIDFQLNFPPHRPQRKAKKAGAK